MQHLTEDILLKKHGMTEVMFRLIMECISQILWKKNYHLYIDLVLQLTTQNLHRRNTFDIAIELCRRLGVELSDDEIKAEANKWELSHGGISGRTAQQFANYLAGQQK